MRRTGDGRYEDGQFEYVVAFDGRAIRRSPSTTPAPVLTTKGLVTKAARAIFRAAPTREFTLSEIRQLTSAVVGFEVSQAQANTAIWGLQQREEVERTSELLAGGHRWSPEATTYRWRGATDDAALTD